MAGKVTDKIKDVTSKIRERATIVLKKTFKYGVFFVKKVSRLLGKVMKRMLYYLLLTIAYILFTMRKILWYLWFGITTTFKAWRADAYTQVHMNPDND